MKILKAVNKILSKLYKLKTGACFMPMQTCLLVRQVFSCDKKLSQKKIFNIDATCKTKQFLENLFLNHRIHQDRAH